jgi:hypothetical protein
MSSLQSPSVFGSKFDAPEPDGFITDSDTTFGKQIFNISMAQVESIIQPDGVADDF